MLKTKYHFSTQLTINYSLTTSVGHLDRTLVIASTTSLMTHLFLNVYRTWMNEYSRLEVLVAHGPWSRFKARYEADQDQPRR